MDTKEAKKTTQSHENVIVAIVFCLIIYTKYKNNMQPHSNTPPEDILCSSCSPFFRRYFAYNINFIIQ